MPYNKSRKTTHNIDPNPCLKQNLHRIQRHDTVTRDIFADMPKDDDEIVFRPKQLNQKPTKSKSNKNNDTVVKNLKLAEERRLKADIKQGTVHRSQVLSDMIKRCPDLEQSIQQILDGNDKQPPAPTKKSNSIPENRKTSDKKNVRGIKRKNSKLGNQINKKPRYDKDVKDWVEDLGSEDTDEEDRDVGDQGDDIDLYQEDGFVTYSDESDDPDDLMDDNIRSNPNVTKKELNCINQKIKEIRENQSESRIDITKVMMAKFNKEDSLWFYKNIKRLPLLDGQERFNLEDKIEKRYGLLKNLQEADMYENFNTGSDNRDTTRDILMSKHPVHVKRTLLNKMYTVTNESMEEYQKALNWMDTVLNIPTEVKSSKHNISKTMNCLYEKLQHNLHGMDNAIKQILQAVCTILTDPNNEGYILTLVGPPGVGKTTISTLIAEAIGMGFGQISCGSIADQATIVGHGSTYIGSKPGVFTQCLINNRQLDNVILLDEMDKMYDSKILPMLLHVLDRSQNNRFKDAFCPEIDIDLSKNLYIVAVNSLDSFDGALRDRLKIVHIDGYDVEQKTQICTKHIIPRLIKKTSVSTVIDQQIVKRCIDTISPSVSGVRDLERFFGDIYEKLLLVKHMGGELFGLPANFKTDNLKKIDLKIIHRLTGQNI
jgi:hypothetical protein